jgi:hypothetical protein
MCGGLFGIIPSVGKSRNSFEMGASMTPPFWILFASKFFVLLI